MTHSHRILVASFVSCLGCGDFTPVQTPLVNSADGGGGGGVMLNGCAPELFVNRSADDAARIIGFGGEAGSGGFSFAPKCLTIAAGQTVTWTGAFAAHPLTRGVPGNVAGGSAGSPIPTTMTGTSVAVTFPRAGTFPYVCGMHAFLGMTGVVVVR